MPLFLALGIIYSIDRLEGFEHISFFSFALLVAISIILYCLCIISNHKKELIRLVQENAILKYKLRKEGM